nr:copia protein [Tanacetum cinerariifolium]
MESCDLVGNPMEIKDKLDLDQNGTPVDATKYRSMIGAIMYLMSSRPDIVHATCLCARYQAKPTEKHLKEVKRIFRYLQGTVNTGLWLKNIKKRTKSDQKRTKTRSVRNKQEKDKIETKPDQIKKKREAWRSPEKSRVVSVLGALLLQPIWTDNRQPREYTCSLVKTG